MKVKEIDVTANIAWSPVSVCPVRLAAGTAAQQLDATFSTNSALEIYDLNLGEDGSSMKKIGSIPTENRFHKIVWGQGGVVNPENNRSNGLIVGGLDRGFISVYDATKILDGKGDNALVFTKDKHTGQVSALDFNPFQHSLLASGASESEIFIWDMNKPATPMMPGAKSLPAEDVKSVAWNRQVQHILATTFSSRCVVWDLRKNDPIIKIANQGTMRCGSIAWNPQVATQICIASEDDKAPIIELWDLRLASTPYRVLERHSRGVLAVSWCENDPDLLLSCGRDNKIYCWNPNANVAGGEVTCELFSSHDMGWNFDVSWCPKNPVAIAASNFDGKVSIFSLLGGHYQFKQIKTSASIADSFPGMEAMQPLCQPVLSTGISSTANQLKIVPKWMKIPFGARFGFGGVLVSSGKNVNCAKLNDQFNHRANEIKSVEVFLSKVVTETNLLEKSTQLQAAISNGDLLKFCDLKITECTSEEQRQVWKFVKANLSDNPSYELCKLLGYCPETVRQQIASVVEMQAINLQSLKRNKMSSTIHHNVDEMIDKFGSMNGTFTADSLEHYQSDLFQHIVQPAKGDGPLKKGFVIFTGNSTSGILNKALLTKNLDLAVDLCIQHERFADALILAMQGSTELFEKTRDRYLAKFDSNDDCELKLIKAIVNSDWSSVIERCDIEQNWKECLVAALIYHGNPYQDTVGVSKIEQLCSMIGSCLLKIKTPDTKQKALLCFICAGDIENTVHCWDQARTNDLKRETRLGQLQNLIEVIMILRIVAHHRGKECNLVSIAGSDGELSKKLFEYTSELVSQGALETALVYLGKQKDENENKRITEMRERVNGAIGATQTYNSSQNLRSPSVKKNPPIYGEKHRYCEKSNDRKDLLENTFFSNARNKNNDLYDPSANNVSPPSMNIFTPNIARQTSYMHKSSNLDFVSSNSSTKIEYTSCFGKVPTSSGPGWNDPPPIQAITSKFKAKTTTVSESTSTPIMQPLIPDTNTSFGANTQLTAANWSLPPTYSENVTSSYVPSSNQPRFASSHDASKVNTPNSQSYNTGMAISNNHDENSKVASYPQFITESLPPIQSQMSNTGSSNLYCSFESKVDDKARYPVYDPSNFHNHRSQFNEFQIQNAPLAADMQLNNKNLLPPPIIAYNHQDSYNHSNSMERKVEGSYHVPKNQQSTFPPAYCSNMEMNKQSAATENQSSISVNRHFSKIDEGLKKEIPSEHQIVHEVFQGLQTRCVAGSLHPQTRRKLEDVGKKLEILYDKLRDNSLTPTTLGCLHQLITYLGESSDYQNAMLYYNSMVSGPSFSEIAAFAPTIKILIQQAIQLQIVW